ncbi:MAG: transketolase C-terminal domain-containing protein [Eubacteriales bacterium]|nr:transketolase C-terminal domain-containing protein [Eubacteriales bacterium]
MSKQNQRKAYGEALVKLGEVNKNVVVLDADLSKSTMGCLFEAAFPERYFEMGIKEQDMMSTAAGLACSGKIAFANSFAVFATGRPFDQIRQTISIGRLNVKICGSSAGFSDFGDGSTHQSVEDMAIMNTIPGMVVLTPADANETKAAVMAAAEHQGPVYIRLCRNDVLDVTPEDKPFEIGKLNVIREGSDAVIFSMGTMVERALEAADELEKEGISTEVINVATLKPFDYEGAAALCEGKKAAVVAEEASFIGGLTGAVATALRKSSVPMDYVAVEDSFGQSAQSAEELMDLYGLTAENIVSKVKALI